MPHKVEDAAVDASISAVDVVSCIQQLYTLGHMDYVAYERLSRIARKSVDQMRAFISTLASQDPEEDIDDLQEDDLEEF